MEPPQKKHRTSSFTLTARPTQHLDPQTAKALEVAAKLNQSLIGTGNYSIGTPMTANMMSALGLTVDKKEHFTVPSDKVGLLIGKGGSKIREIQQLSGARMEIEQVDNPSTPNLRNVTLTGTPTSIASARGMIDSIVNELPRGPRGNIAPPNPKKTIQIPSASVGLVIGKGGDNIRKIIQETGSTIHIEKEGEAEVLGHAAPPPGYQNVYLKGSDEAVRKAEAAILTLVNGDFQRRTKVPTYGQYGQQQLVIPQYQQAYGYQAYAPQQLISYQQPYAVPGQTLMQPTYGVMPGYPSQAYLQAPPQPGTMGLAQYGNGNSYPQYHAQPVYHQPMMSYPNNGSPMAQPQFVQTQEVRLDSTPQKQPNLPPVPQQQPSSPPVGEDQQIGQFEGLQNQPGQVGEMPMSIQNPPHPPDPNMLNSIQAGVGPNTPPTSTIVPPSQSVSSDNRPDGVLTIQQYTTQANGEINVNMQIYPSGIGPTQPHQEVSSNPLSNMPYNSQGVTGSSAQSQQVNQINREQNLIPPLRNSPVGATSRING